MHRELVQSQVLAAYLADRAKHYGREMTLNLIELSAIVAMVGGAVAIAAGIVG